MIKLVVPAAIAAAVVGVIVDMLYGLVMLMNKLVDLALILGVAGIVAATLFCSLREILGHRLDVRNAQTRRERVMVLPATVVRPVHQPVAEYRPTFTIAPTPIGHIRRELR